MALKAVIYGMGGGQVKIKRFFGEGRGKNSPAPLPTIDKLTICMI